MNAARKCCAPLAQLDRASDYGSEGREFESLRAYQRNQILRPGKRPAFFFDPPDCSHFAHHGHRKAFTLNFASVGRKIQDYFYSLRSMSDTYAGILAWKAEGPLRLIAEVVRENSRLYPRPVPMMCFMEPPFDLTEDEICECLEALGEGREYQDIVQTITSIGRTFLYSSRHLDPDHAATLAEWIDVGQADNP